MLIITFTKKRAAISDDEQETLVALVTSIFTKETWAKLQHKIARERYATPSGKTVYYLMIKLEVVLPAATSVEFLRSLINIKLRYSIVAERAGIYSCVVFPVAQPSTRYVLDCSHFSTFTLLSYSTLLDYWCPGVDIPKKFCSHGRIMHVPVKGRKGYRDLYRMSCSQIKKLVVKEDSIDFVLACEIAGFVQQKIYELLNFPPSLLPSFVAEVAKQVKLFLACNIPNSGSSNVAEEPKTSLPDLLQVILRKAIEEQLPLHFYRILIMLGAPVNGKVELGDKDSTVLSMLEYVVCLLATAENESQKEQVDYYQHLLVELAELGANLRSIEPDVRCRPQLFGIKMHNGRDTISELSFGVQLLRWAKQMGSFDEVACYDQRFTQFARDGSNIDLYPQRHQAVRGFIKTFLDQYEADITDITCPITAEVIVRPFVRLGSPGNQPFDVETSLRAAATRNGIGLTQCVECPQLYLPDATVFAKLAKVCQRPPRPVVIDGVPTPHP